MVAEKAAQDAPGSAQPQTASALHGPWHGPRRVLEDEQWITVVDWTFGRVGGAPQPPEGFLVACVRQQIQIHVHVHGKCCSDLKSTYRGPCDLYVCLSC